MSRFPIETADRTRSNFIAEYAAKRQSQMDRARQLREQRTGGSGQTDHREDVIGVRQPTSLQQQQVGGGRGMDEMQAKPQTLRSSAAFTASDTASYQPTGSAYGAHVQRGEYPPPLSSHVTPASYHAQPRVAAVAAVEVTEDSFREATQRGIITPDQARQLWAVLSDQATQIGPSTRGSLQPMQASTRNPTMVSQSPSATASGYDPRQYAASQAPQGGTYRGSFVHQLAQRDQLDTDEVGYHDGVPSKLAKATASRASRRPEWNNDFQEPVSYSDAPETRGPPSRNAPTNIAPSSRNARPEWNGNSDVAHNESAPQSFDDRPAAAAQARSGVRGRREAEEVVPLEQMMPPRQLPVKQPASRQQAAQTPGAKRSAAPPNSRMGGGRQPQPEPEPEVVQQSPEEIEEFRRLKEAARRQFEEALEEANTNEELVPCGICGRNFRLSIIDRHEGACQAANKKRKVFDSKINRLSGIEGMEDVLLQQQRANRRGGKAAQQQAAAPPASRGAPRDADMPANKMPKWKLQHQQFQAALAAIKGNGPAPAMAESLDDRVPCPHCSRKFAKESADRHIPHCAKTINKPKPVVRPGPTSRR